MRDRVAVIAHATFREALRDRVLLVVLLFAVGVVLFSRVLGWLSVEDELKMVQDVSLSGLSLLGLLIAMLLGAFSIAREAELVVGKYFGLVGASWIALLAAALALLVWLAAWGAAPGAAFAAALVGLLCEALLVMAVAIFMGALTSPPIAAVCTAAFSLAAHSTEALRELTMNGKSPFLAATWSILYRLLPNLEDVNFINATLSDAPIRWGALGAGALAMVLWSTLFVGGAALLFRRREI
jgi:ABC-type transport system involved in multi-copper enzyme maturation permease subunit